MYKFQPVLELLRNKSVIEIQDAFEEDYESDEEIHFDAFNVLLKTKLGLDIEDSDAYHLFCQVDRYFKATVTSTELISYLREYEKKRLLPPEGPFETNLTIYPSLRCQDRIIEWLLYPEEVGVQCEIAGHYISLSKSGLVSIWDRKMQMRFQTTIESSSDGVITTTSLWATGLTVLPKEKLVAVATTAGDIRFFRSSTYKFEMKFSIICLPYIVLNMHCYNSQILVCGDFSGKVFIIYMRKVFFDRILGRASHLDPEKIIFERIRTGRVYGLEYQGANKMHFTPVQKVEYIQTLVAVISCSTSTERAMMIHSLEKDESLGFKSLGGVNCFAFCERQNCVITGGVDHAVKIWNPKVNTKFIESLDGHTSPVNHVVVMQDYLISTDYEKTLRVWDLVRPNCLQIIKFKEPEFPGKQSFASCFLDPTNGGLILTTNKIGKLEMRKTAYRDKTHPCSEHVVLAAYSSIYNCLVTVGNSSAIAVWDRESGALIYEYSNTHTVTDSVNVPRNMLVLAAGLDPSQRRLITADRIGQIKVWNFHLGLCLQSFQIHFRILSLSFVDFHIYAAGESRAVVDCYDNGAVFLEPVTWEKRHKKSIVSVDFYRNILLASASCEGEIFIWLQKSFEAKIRLKDSKEDDEKSGAVDPDFLAKADLDRSRECSISQILFLQKRDMDYQIGNLVSCGMDGRIRFWNIVWTNKVNEGTLLTKFKPVFRENDGVSCIATDAQNHYLISGDSMGYVRVYELDGYYAAYGSGPPRRKATPELLEKFPFLHLKNIMDEKYPECSKFSDGSEVGFPPFLLNCFRAYVGSVHKVSYVADRDIVITAGRETSVRLWTISGVYIGRLGPSDEPWGLAADKKNNTHKPPDVKSVASALTLFVLNDGRTPYWRRAFEALRRCRLGHQPEDFSENPLKWKLKKSASIEKLPTDDRPLQEDITKRLPYFQGTRACKQKIYEDINAEWKSS